MNDHDRIIQLEVRAAAAARELEKQAIEYERRLGQLNGEADRIRSIAERTVSAEKFNDYLRSQATADNLRGKVVDERIGRLENWQARAAGVATLLTVFAGLIGAAVMRALGG